MTAAIRMLIVLLGLAPLLEIQPVAAAAGADATPVVGCQRPARSLDELHALAAAGQRATPNPAEIAPTALPHGAPVNSVTAELIRGTLDEMAACAMTGDGFRLFAYFSDDWLSSGRLSPSAIDDLATPVPAASPDEISVRVVTDIERLPDGRVGALVTLGGLCEQSQPQPICVQYIGFVQQDGLWHVDFQIDTLTGPNGYGIIPIAEYLQEHGTPVATPAA